MTKFLKTVFCAAALSLTALAPAAAQAPTVALPDFAPLFGKEMTGALFYKDYGSGAQYDIPAAARIDKTADMAILFDVSFPEEPQADYQDTIAISDGGRRFGEETVIARLDAPPRTHFITRSFGEDNGVSAEFRTIYDIGACHLLIAKSVKTEGADTFFERNRLDLSAEDCG